MMSSAGKRELIEAIGRQVMRYQDATQSFDEAVGQLYDLNAAERHCLSFLWQGPQTPGAIAREIRLTPAAVTALIDRLEKRGYVERRGDANDRRKSWISTTERTAQLTAATYARNGDAGVALLSAYSAEELRVIARFLDEATALQERLTDELLEGSRG